MAGRGLLWLLAAAGLAATLGAADEQRPLGKSSDILKSKNPFTSEFSELVNKSLHHWKVPGISIAVIDDDDVYAEVSRAFNPARASSHSASFENAIHLHRITIY